jgi:hypothetical protein
MHLWTRPSPRSGELTLRRSRLKCGLGEAPLKIAGLRGGRAKSEQNSLARALSLATRDLTARSRARNNYETLTCHSIRRAPGVDAQANARHEPSCHDLSGGDPDRRREPGALCARWTPAPRRALLNIPPASGGGARRSDARRSRKSDRGPGTRTRGARIMQAAPRRVARRARNGSVAGAVAESVRATDPWRLPDALPSTACPATSGRH